MNPTRAPCRSPSPRSKDGALPVRASLFAVAAALALPAIAGCTTLSPPFSEMKGAQMTVYRLQDYVPPATPAPAASPLAALIPPQVQQWVSAGASLLPPSLLSGLLPGSATPAVPDAQRFPPNLGAQGFPILAYQQVTDPAVASEILDVLGHPSEYQAPAQVAACTPRPGHLDRANEQPAAGELPRVALVQPGPGVQHPVALRK